MFKIFCALGFSNIAQGLLTDYVEIDIMYP